MQRYSDNFINSNGRPVAGATVTVLTYPAGVSATLYSDNGVTPLANPLTTDALGLFAFYAPDGRYSITITSDKTEPVTRTDVQLEDPADTPAVAKSELSADNGAGLVGFKQSGSGATMRTILEKLRDTVSVRDFGAVGDGVADDTAALQAAFDACRASGKTLRINAGRYSTTQTISAAVSAAQNLNVIGDGFGKSVIVKTAANTDPVLRLGSAAATSYTANVDVSNFTVEGAGATTTLVGVELFDVVQSRVCVRARLCVVGLKSNGGISLDLSGSDLSNNGTGFVGTKFTSLAGGGWPNIIHLNRANIKNNTKRGVDFDYGRVLNLNGCDIESNGTSGDATTAGVWIGSHIGQESGLLSPGVNIGGGTWLEANAGRAAVVWESGRNSMKDSYLIANALATNDIYISGGRYVLKDLDFDTNKAANVEETAGVLSKNYILNCDYNAGVIDVSKTVVMNAAGLSNVAVGAMTLTATGQTSLGGAAGAEAFRAKTTASAVNRVFVKGSITGQPVQFGAEGEANVGFYGVTSGTGIWQFTTGSGANEQVRINHVASADRALILSGGVGGDSFLSSTAGGIQFGCIPKLPSYTVGTLPSAATNTKGFIYVSDGAANKRLAVSDGTNWRWPDGAIVS